MKENDSTHPELHFAVLAADTTLFTLRDGTLYVRLMNIDRPPYFVDIKGLPGGLLAPSETAEHAALRHVEDKAGIEKEKVYAEQLYTFSHVDRDPRGRVVAVAYLALIPWESLHAKEQQNTALVEWIPLSSVPKLAYDHSAVVKMALARLRSRITYTTLIQKLLPAEFTLTELEEAYEHILGKEIDKRNFRKKIEKLELLTPLERFREGGRFRPARLHCFKSKEVREVSIL